MDRQLAIVLLLQNRRVLDVEKIAEYFETSVKTVSRDIQVLSDAGLPIVALPGERYAIMDGYKLPPLTFDRAELLALHMGLEFVGKHRDRAIREAGQRARAKVESVLPTPVRIQYDHIVDELPLQMTPSNTSPRHRESRGREQPKQPPEMAPWSAFRSRSRSPS
jgi:predicted DNA-binding transcriptional regulator YafY